MATYRVTDLLERLAEISNDGYEFVNLLELDPSDEDPASLSFEALDDEDVSVDYEEVDAISFSEDDSHLSSRFVEPDDFCFDTLFTYTEIFRIHHALDNAISSLADYSKDNSYSKSEQAEIKEALIGFRNLKAKIEKTCKRFKL